MSSIQFAIITFPRTPQYLHRMINSLRETGFFDDAENLPLRLVCSAAWGAVSSELDEYRNNPEFLVEEVAPEDVRTFQLEDEQKENAPAQRDLCLNHRRALLGFLKSDADYVVVLEDDIRVARGWLPRLRETISEVQATHPSRWIMTLCVIQSEDPLWYAMRGKRWFYDTRLPYYGTQAIVYPRMVAIEFEFVIHQQCVNRYKYAIDLLVGIWAFLNNCRIVATAPSLIQHIGEVSTGCSPTGAHKTKGFIEDLAKLAPLLQAPPLPGTMGDVGRTGLESLGHGGSDA